MTRQIVLDTETTGLETSDGHRVIEIGCVEMINRRLTGRNFHQYLNPDRQVDAGAVEVHGLSNDFLEDKPRFEEVVDDFIDYIHGAELVIHNAPFDVGFLDNELKLLRRDQRIEGCCSVLDTLVMARRMHPGQRNSLDALCKRYEVDNSNRDLHGALLDAEILADVYLAMTGGQKTLLLDGEEDKTDGAESRHSRIRRVKREGMQLRVLQASEEERRVHDERMRAINEKSGGAVWLQEAEQYEHS
ncbi:DNA polymerase-3 subunit epsilon [Natronospira proteinivora]|uniref:DNA polymerase III subunit epsilon n=1 Tax=Natronospira proteinivora TaxID=1807133 RepID=A0ABT1GAX8_9GAMM|nr:DNA polymerase III subunit epsilon [Natronospira proteinivora]MCP1727072.1 DNA polymerase-3 subunit epsilon [Natronospira proteinivora]